MHYGASKVKWDSKICEMERGLISPNFRESMCTISQEKQYPLKYKNCRVSVKFTKKYR